MTTPHIPEPKAASSKHQRAQPSPLWSRAAPSPNSERQRARQNPSQKDQRPKPSNQNPTTPRTQLPAEVEGTPRRPSACIHTLQPRGILSTGATVSFKTIGCRLNQAETDQISEQFTKAGYQIVAPGTECDVAVINTCTITHGAERDSARWARRLRRKGAKTVILAGCAVEHNGQELKEKTGADIIANQKDKYHLLDLLPVRAPLVGAASSSETKDQRPETRDQPVTPEACEGGSPENGGRRSEVGDQIKETSNHRPSSTSHVYPSAFSVQRSPQTRALIKAQDGCNFRCSYCIVPDTRGLPHSLPINDVLNDIRKKADQGYREIVITGANIGCYNYHGNTLINLLEKAEEIEGIERIRISSIESTTAERQVIDFMATSSKLCHFLHLPLQSGDDQTLKQMRRHYTAAQYRETVEYAMSRIPNLGLGTDIIVGFPGETDQSFQNTLNLVKNLPFTNLHVFSYSKRSGTPAAEMPNQIDPTIKKERSAELISLGKSKRKKFAKSFISKEVNVLVEKVDHNGIASGWTEEYLRAEFTTPNALENQIITFTPTKTNGDRLI